MSLIDTRHDQMFPVLSIPQIETAMRFASADARQFAPGELVFDVGERQAPAWLVLEGEIEVIRRDGRAGRRDEHRSRWKAWANSAGTLTNSWAPLLGGRAGRP